MEFQSPLEGVQQQYGFNTNNLKNIIDFWLNNYDWRKREILLNKFPQYTVKIQGLKIHYLHVKPNTTITENLKILPLLILHGWPSSVREFFDLIPILTSPIVGRDFVFEVIAPSLPGMATFFRIPSVNEIRVALKKNLLLFQVLHFQKQLPNLVWVQMKWQSFLKT